MKHELKVPSVGESIQEVQIGQWLKGEGQWAAKDENLVEIESDKATVELAAPAAGILLQVLHRQGDVVPVGALIGYLEEAPQPDGARHDVERIANPSHAPTSASAAPAVAPPQPAPPPVKAAAPRLAPESPSSVRSDRETARDAVGGPPSVPAPPPVPADKGESAQLVPSENRPAAQISALHGASPRAEEIVPMTWLRRRIA